MSLSRNTNNGPNVQTQELDLPHQRGAVDTWLKYGIANPDMPLVSYDSCTEKYFRTPEPTFRPILAKKRTKPARDNTHAHALLKNVFVTHVEARSRVASEVLTAVPMIRRHEVWYKFRRIVLLLSSGLKRSKPSKKPARSKLSYVLFLLFISLPRLP
jgi:hypothetical protein